MERPYDLWGCTRTLWAPCVLSVSWEPCILGVSWVPCVLSGLWTLWILGGSWVHPACILGTGTGICALGSPDLSLVFYPRLQLPHTLCFPSHMEKFHVPS